ncbi:MAG: hypothetical protein QNJ90_16090 [Planctomycetota bacterium]|nr:hypothetical protein [Planctomycetota bacterium]
MEQTSATVCPMVLALDYMQQTKTASPELETKAKKYVTQGYQRLLTFESKQHPGGFALWKGGRPSIFLTAYGLMQFVDMQRVHAVEPELLTRMRAFLRKYEQEDGSFAAGNLVHSWGPWKESRFYMTAYVAWALARAGEDTVKARAWLRANEAEVEDPYGVALAALACAAADPKSAESARWAKRLVALQSDGPDGGGWTATEGGTFIGARGGGARVETTAMAALVLLQTGLHQDLAYGALDALVAKRMPDGRFGSTHSTALALRALLAASSGGEALPATQVTVLRGDKRTRTVEIPRGSTEPVRVPVGTLDPADLRLRLESQGRLRGTLSRTTYEEWPKTRLPRGPVALDVTWSARPLAVDQVYEARVVVRNTGSKPAKVVTVELGLPPGITVKPKDVKGAGLQEAERAERHLVLYLDDIAPGDARTLVVPYRTRHAFEAQTAHSRVYEYYVEEEQTVIPPVRLRCR